MAGSLKRKALMRVAFLQSAHQNMAKNRERNTQDDDSDDDGDADREITEVDPDALIRDVQKIEKKKKAQLAFVHQKATGMLQEAVR